MRSPGTPDWITPQSAGDRSERTLKAVRPAHGDRQNTGPACRTPVGVLRAAPRFEGPVCSAHCIHGSRRGATARIQSPAPVTEQKRARSRPVVEHSWCWPDHGSYIHGYHRGPHHHQPHVRRMAQRVRRSQDDDRPPRSHHAPLRHRRNRQRQLLLQEPQLTPERTSVRAACASGRATPSLRRKQCKNGQTSVDSASAIRGSVLGADRAVPVPRLFTTHVGRPSLNRLTVDGDNAGRASYFWQVRRDLRPRLARKVGQSLCLPVTLHTTVNQESRSPLTSGLGSSAAPAGSPWSRKV